MAGFQDDLEANYYTNVAGFLNVLDVAHHAKVAKLVYASSSAIYFDGKYSQLAQKLGEAFTEEDPFINPLRLHTHYGKSKLINEMIAASYDSAYNFSTLGLRYFNVYGAGDEKKTNRCAPVQHFINSRKEGKPIVIYGDGSQAKDFIYVDDAIDITFRLLESNADGVCNVGTGVATSFNDAADTVDELFQSKSEHRYVPIPNPDSYQYYTRADVSKMLSFVGEHKFTTLREGLGHLV